jgi:hypothetical protein
MKSFVLQEKMVEQPAQTPEKRLGATTTILWLPSMVGTRPLFCNILAHPGFLCNRFSRLFELIHLMILNEKKHTKEIPTVTVG